MRHVYANSCCNIAATASEIPDTGILYMNGTCLRYLQVWYKQTGRITQMRSTASLNLDGTIGVMILKSSTKEAGYCKSGFYPTRFALPCFEIPARRRPTYGLD